MYFRESEREITGLEFSRPSVLALICAVVGTLYLGIFPANVSSFPQKSDRPRADVRLMNS